MGAGGAEGGGVDFEGGGVDILIFNTLVFLFIEWKSNETKGTPNVSIIKHSNESHRYASNSKTKSFNFKYHIYNTGNYKILELKINNQRLKKQKRSIQI